MDGAEAERDTVHCRSETLHHSKRITNTKLLKTKTATTA